MTILSLIKYLWASPASFLSLIPNPLAMMQGGSVRIVEGVVEASGGVITSILKNGIPLLGKAAAITLGHVVLGCDSMCLDKSRKHERIHVQHCERWGPLFIPCYLTVSFIINIKGGDPYGDNPFEKEAVEKTIGNV